MFKEKAVAKQNTNICILDNRIPEDDTNGEFHNEGSRKHGSRNDYRKMILSVVVGSS